jgi:DNA-binding NarL/FixJ family response regulator
MLTTFELDEYVFEALRGGASGFPPKDSPSEELLRAAHVVAAGESLLLPSVTRRVVEHFAGGAQQRSTAPAAQASDRARAGDRRLGRDRPVQRRSRGAARRQPGDGAAHVSRAMIRFAARDRAQLVVFAVRSGLDIPD